MNVALGLKAHSGWAALVVVGDDGGHPVVVDRRRIELAEEEWAKQPYHAAEELEPARARTVVDRGIAAAHDLAGRELAAAVARERARGHRVAACAVLMAAPMPPWSTDEILAVHFRMHKAEGVLFKDALASAARAARLALVAIPEKTLATRAEKALGRRAPGLMKEVAALGKTVGPPWGKDQKDATLAAVVALYAQP